MNNTPFIDYPFIADGVKFISRVYQNAPMATRIAQIPAEVFAEMNAQVVLQVIGDASLFTRNELLEQLDRVNEGGSTAFVLLDESYN